jgi:ferredoxin like protein
MVDYTRCIECGTCPFGCPNGNIHWKYPPGGYG